MIYTGPTGGAIRSSSLASLLRCSRLSKPSPYPLQICSVFGSSDYEPTYAYEVITTGYSNSAIAYDIRDTPTSVYTALGTVSLPAQVSPGPGDTSWPSAFPGGNQPAIRSVASDYWIGYGTAAQTDKVKITGPCSGTLLQYPPIPYAFDGYIINVDMTGPPYGQIAGSYLPFSAVAHTLGVGETLEFYPTSTPYLVGGGGNPTLEVVWKAQAFFCFGKSPSDFTTSP